MDIGILQSAVAAPRFRLTGEQLTLAWGERVLGDRTVCFHDEDATTLAVDAALAAGGDGLLGVELLLCATVSAPFAERSTAVQVAAACDAADPTCRDLGGSRRAGLGALWLAAQAVRSGEAGRALAVASDARVAEPRDVLEASLGHGAAAFLVGPDPAATFLARGAAFADYLEAFRPDGERFVRAEGGRLERTESLLRPIAAAVKSALERAGLTADKVAHFAVGAPDEKAAQAVAKACGVRKEAVVDAQWSRLGDWGTANALLGLAAALERAAPGEVLVVAAAGDGAEAVVLQATERIAQARPPRGASAWASAGRAVPSYTRLLSWRGMVVPPPDSPALSSVLLHHDEPMLARRTGYRCTACGLIAYPPGKLCARCRSVELKPHRLGRTGAVFTFTRDRLFQGFEPETAMTVVDLDGGGRVFVQATDCDPSEIDVGRRVELVYRRLHQGGGHPSYYWKARPV